MGPVKNLTSTQIRSLQITSKTTIKLLLLGVVIAAVPLGLSVRVNSKNSKTAVTVQAAGRGKPYLNLEDGRAMEVAYRGDQLTTSGLQNGAAKSRALATADLNGDAAPDLVAGYAYNGAGIVTIQKGNIEGFAPKDDSVFERMQQGYNPDSLLPTVDTYPVSEAVDFLSVGDFNEDGRRDVLVASKGGSLQLLAGDGEGQLQAAKQIDLPGRVLALTVGEFRAADGRNDVAVALSGAGGSEVLIFDGAAGGFESAPFRFPLNADAVSVEFGELDADPFMDLAIAGGSEVNIIHGWGRKTEARLGARVERISLPYTAQTFAVDNFTWDRQGTREIAVLSAEGAVHVLEHSRSQKRAFTEEEILARSAARGRMTNLNADVEVVEGWTRGKGGWNEVNKLVLNAGMKTEGASQGLLTHGKISSGETNALMVLNTAQKRLEVVHQVTSDELSRTPESKLRSGDLSTASLDANATPAAMVALPKKLNGVRDLVVLSDGSSMPVLVPITPNLTFGVNTTSDHAPDGACNASPDCTFREAVIAANASAGPDTVSLPAGTYTLTIIGNTDSSGTGEGFSGNAAIGDVDFRDANGDATTVTGAGAASTFIVQSTANDRTLEPNPTALLNFDWTISAVTIAGGRDTGGSATGGGGSMLSGSKDNITTITNCVIANNRASGTGTTGGGAILNEGGVVTITNTTIGGAVTVAACPGQTATNCGNSSSSSGGGIVYSPGDPLNRQPSAGTLTIQTTSSFTNNTAAALTAGGGGVITRTHNLGTGSVSISGTTFTSNLATGSASGGGLFVESIATTVATTSFVNNTSANRGGGIQVAGGSLTLNGTSPSITFTGNTATTAGGSISASSAVNLQGTNTTIGGDLEITTNGVWTNEVGSTMSPNNLIIIGTGSFTANNSTTNVSGNFQFQSGTFNAGTGLFNFNGTTAQTINNSVSITFNNLTDSNTTQPLTINNNIVVNGTLNVNGAGATLAPLAGTVISGAGTLTGTGTARVTRTAATADFLSQYTITNKTLTNLTVEYIGTAPQVVSAITYGPLKITNGSGVTLATGTSTVNGLLTLMTGNLNVGATSILVINNGSAVGTGTLSSNAAGTVNYNQGSAGQAVLAFNYGNLTFSNFDKVLAGTGTIGVAGVFTPGTAVGHTIAGSTINFNGTGAQTIPAFNYFNLSTSGAHGANNITLVNGGTIGIAGAFSPTATFAGGAYVITNNTVNFNGTGSQTIPAFNYNNLTTSSARGANNITLINGGTIGIAGTFNPTATFAGGGYVVTNNTVVYNGTSPQILPVTFTTYNNLTLNNAAGVSGFAGLIVQGLLRVQAGTFTSSSSTYNNVQIDIGATLAGTNGTTINVSGNWTNNGTFTANTNTVNFNGSGAQVIGGSSATTFNNLTIANAGSGVSLGQNATVNAVLTLTNNLTTGANILTMPNTGTSAGTADVIGNVRRTGFTGGGPALSFGNPFTSIGFIAQGTVPTDILVNLVKATPTGPPAFPTAVQRTYTITPTGGAGYSATLRLHYLDTELNGNVEADLGLWRLSGGVWARQGRTGAVDTVNNWAELSGVTQFSPWTLASAKNDTTTTITSDNPDPSNVGEVVTVNYTVTSNVAGAPAVTGNVTITVNDASGDTCTGTVAAGTCALTLTTGGSKTLTATYSSDANFNGGSDTEPHGVTQTDIFVRDARVAEPTSGTTNMLFTVALSTPAPGPVSVNFATADGGATPATGGATCGGAVDYETTNGTVNFIAGEQIKTVAIQVCSDGTVEPDETFLVNLSSPVNGTIVDGQATGTITAANTPGEALISEIRTSGPGGSADEYVELYNNSDAQVIVQADDASPGVGLFKMGADCNAAPELLGFIPNGTTIPARGHYLFVGSAYSLGTYATGDQTMTSDIENDRNVGFFATTSIANLSSDTRLDAVGFGTNTGGGVCDLLREGTNLQPAAGSTSQYGFVRKLTTGTPLDTNDNAADFAVVSITPAVAVGSNPLPILGAPGPENQASPIQRNATIKPSLIDPTQPSTADPNRVRDPTPGTPGSPTAFGTLDFRRKFTNNTGQIVTQLRIRVVDITTTNTPGVSLADLRMLSSTDTTANGGTITILGTTLQSPSVNPPGGGLNTSVTVAVPGGTLAPGASVNIRLLTGVAAGGTFRFFINVEALP